MADVPIGFDSVTFERAFKCDDSVVKRALAVWKTGGITFTLQSFSHAVEHWLRPSLLPGLEMAQTICERNDEAHECVADIGDVIDRIEMGKGDPRDD